MPSGILDDTHLRFFTRKTVDELFEKTGYFIHQIDYTKLPIFDQNPLIPCVKKENFAVELIDIFKEDKNIDILQFVIKAFPNNFDNKYFSLKENHEIVVKNLQETQSQLQETQSQLQETQSQLQETQSQLQETQSQLQETQSQLQETQSQLQETQSQLQETQSQLQETQSQLQETQSQVQETQSTILAMETSKFWKLRKIWFKFKTIFKIKKKVRKIVNLILNLRLIFILVFTYGLSYTVNMLKQKEEIPLSDDIRYQQWLNKNYPKTTDLIFMTEDIKNLSYKPVISVIMPVYNTPKDFLKKAIDSVLNQIYPYWELCIADDASTKPYIQEILQEYIARDKRIKVAFRKENGHISKSSNSAIELASGEYIALLDHDDLLTTHALYEVVKLLNNYPEADMIYSDEDKINEEEKLQDPYFKPDWCPDSFLSRMYTCHLGVYRRDLVKEIGGFREGYEGSQDYDLVLRLTEKTDKIFHIPNILYHWRIHAESTAQNISTKNYATIAAQRAIKDALERRGEPGKVIPVACGHHIVRYEIKHHDLVSIIIPTKNLGNILNTCLKSIFEKTTYSNYEVLVIDNGSTEKETKEIIELWKIKEPQRFRCEILDIPFNFSKINNYAVKQTKGKYLLFLNNDTEVINNDWLDGMVEQAQRNSIGAVGALLLYPDNTIQHAGVVRGIGGVAGHSHKYFVGDSYGYFNQLKTVNNYSSVTGACLMCRREVFEEVGGFEESLAVAFNDIDLCFKFLEKGYINVYLPHVKLYHYESKSRGYEDTPEKQERFSNEVKYMQSKWQKIIDYDPCYSPNLTRQTEDYAIDVSWS
ncbi:glycosyltransferase [Anabaena aphanizomenioides LEGE 00250]|uniref:Glycosyltransferase n=3 Tax=Sphaerospermopsis TaxID=752201 RepID=A0ABR9VCK9_9CYAN|nr:glycosyltransferase [Sphaerospermopsis aphanizomenoides LEGE 00250]